MNCSSQDIFAWTGAVLVNIGFVAIIGWGSFQYTWYIGFALAAFYSAALFCFARQLEKKQERLDAEQQPSSSYGRLISILYCLAVIALGVTGFFLPANLFGECNQNWAGGGGSYYSSSDRWETDITTLPAAVQDWAAEEHWKGSDGDSSFVYLSATKTTLFRGGDKSYDEYLWTVVDGSEPVLHKSVPSPRNFIRTTETTACFSSDGVVCYMEQEVRRISTTGDDEEFDYVEDLASFDEEDGTVWYKGVRYETSGSAIVSVDPITAIQTIHSRRVIDGSDNSVATNTTLSLSDSDAQEVATCSSTTKRLQTVCFLFTSAIPVFCLSILLWKSKTISSMGLTSYVGFLAIFSAVVHVIDPSSFLWDSYVQAAGFAVFGAVYVLYFMLRAVFDRDTPAMRWGAHTAAVGFVIAMVHLLFFLPSSTDSFWSWFTLVVVAFVPLSLIGAVSESWLLSLLGALGSFSFSIRVCIYLVSKASGSGAVLIGFATLAVAGVVVGCAGVALSKYRLSLKKVLANLLAPIDGRVENLMGSVATESPPDEETGKSKTTVHVEVPEESTQDSC